MKRGLKLMLDRFLTHCHAIVETHAPMKRGLKRADATIRIYGTGGSKHMPR